MKDTYSIDVVGCGAVASYCYVPIIEKHPRTVLGACCDVDEGKSVGSECGVPSFTDHTEFLASGLVDALVIATPPDSSWRIAIDAANCGIPIFLESPIASSPHDACRLVEAVEAAGVTCMVGLLYRDNLAIQQITEWIAEGRLGASLASRMASFEQAHVADDPEHNERVMAYMRKGSLMLFMGGHYADALAMTYASTPVSVKGWATKTRPNLPQANHWIGIVRFEDGGMATIEMGWMYPSNELDNGSPITQPSVLEFLGDKGVARYNFTNGRLRTSDESGTKIIQMPRAQNSTPATLGQVR